MKGVVLAGGLGSRLAPLTNITNKHLLPVYNKPMIYYPIQTLVNAGIQDVIIVTGGNSSGDFLRLLKNGKEFGLRRLNYAYQEGEGGIADALSYAEDFCEGESMCVVLGDNIIENNIVEFANSFRKNPEGSRILLKEVPDPERFGVPVFDGDNIIKIEEKPKEPKSKYAVIGIYIFDHTVFDKIGKLSPSQRGELEVTDLNNMYLKDGKLNWSILDGWWTDAGTFDSLQRASSLVAETGANKL
ncbi:MAG: NTP transferase domain-containing protein [Acidobacteria bacterium]|nr:NTP transferase domain-containing protein [Acidobacteriota bacterium]